MDVRLWYRPGSPAQGIAEWTAVAPSARIVVATFERAQ
jgi:hypothetical protein